MHSTLANAKMRRKRNDAKVNRIAFNKTHQQMNGMTIGFVNTNWEN